jgi:hypothetical protein
LQDLSAKLSGQYNGVNLFIVLSMHRFARTSDITLTVSLFSGAYRLDGHPVLHFSLTDPFVINFWWLFIVFVFIVWWIPFSVVHHHWTFTAGPHT